MATAPSRKMNQPLATSSYIKVPAPRLNVVRNPSSRVRQAVRDNNVPLLSRLQHKTDLRNTDKNRLTSLSWSAIEGSLEVFEWLLLDYGHDDQELSRDADNNTILHLLASIPSISTSPFNYLLTNSNSDSLPSQSQFQSRSYEEQSTKSLRMTELYYTLFPFLLDWSNLNGKTSLHIAAQSGNYRFIKLLCDLGADLNLTDLQGNTPLHYASAWGNLNTIRVILEENNLQYSYQNSYSGSASSMMMSRNFEGFTPIDFAYNHSILVNIQQISKDLYEERKSRKKEERSLSSSNNNEVNNANRIRSNSLSSSAGGTSNSNLGSGSYQSQPGRYIDQIPHHHHHHQQQQQQPLPIPLQNQILSERTSSLPMSRLDSSASQHGSTTSASNSRDPSISITSKSAQRLNNPPQARSQSQSYHSSPGANPQVVLGRPTPPPLQPPPSPSSGSIPSIPSNQNVPSSNNGSRPMINSRSPSMPSSTSSKPGQVGGQSDIEPPVPTTPITIPKEGLMMGSVMRRANSAQTGFTSVDSNNRNRL